MSRKMLIQKRDFTKGTPPYFHAETIQNYTKYTFEELLERIVKDHGEGTYCLQINKEGNLKAIWIGEVEKTDGEIEFKTTTKDNREEAAFAEKLIEKIKIEEKVKLEEKVKNNMKKLRLAIPMEVLAYHLLRSSKYESHYQMTAGYSFVLITDQFLTSFSLYPDQKGDCYVMFNPYDHGEKMREDTGRDYQQEIDACCDYLVALVEETRKVQVDRNEN